MRPREHAAATTLALLLGLAASAAPAGAGDGLPAPLRTFEAAYEVGNGTFRVGTTRLELAPHARGWIYRSHTEAEGVFSLFVDGAIVEESLVESHAGRLRPLRFSHDDPDDADDVAVEFAWDEGRARVTHGGGKRAFDVEPETRDPLSAILAVIQAAAAGEREIAFPGVDDEGERVTLRFRVGERERVKVPLGTYRAWRVERVRDDKRSTMTWLAPELGWLPVQIEQRRKGELVARMRLKRLDGREAPPEEPETPR